MILKKSDKSNIVLLYDNHMIEFTRLNNFLKTKELKNEL